MCGTADRCSRYGARVVVSEDSRARMLDAIRNHHVVSGSCASIAGIASWNVDAACVAIVADAIPGTADTSVAGMEVNGA